MKFRDTVWLATSIFVHNRLRTVFTILAVGVGIGTIVFLVSLGYGIERIATERFANAAALRTIDVRPLPESGKAISSEVVERLRGFSGVARVDPVIELAGQLRSETIIADLAVVGVAENFFEIEGLSLISGEPLSAEAGAELIITSAVAELMEIPVPEAVGKRYELRVIAETERAETETNLGPVTIKGVILNPTASTVYLGNQRLLPLAGRGLHGLKITARSTEEVKAIKAQVTSLGFEAKTTIEDVESLERGFRVGRILLFILGLIAVSVASIGMLNTMTISLLERIREVGVMKALGAADRDVWQLFLAESALLGLFGGLAGLLLGLLTSRIINLLFNRLAARFGGVALPLFVTPVLFGLGIILFGLIIGFLTGIYPARRAAKLNPVEALRYE